MIVRLPGGRNVVVDAKVPSSAYLDAMEADDELVRNTNCAITRGSCAITSSGSATRRTGSTFSRRQTS